MEAESFEDEEIAAFMNEPLRLHQGRPRGAPRRRRDLHGRGAGADRSGGWPMSVWLTPDREPFFGGTYFPPRDGARGARHGFLELLRDIHQTYLSDRGARRARRRGAGARRAARRWSRAAGRQRFGHPAPASIGAGASPSYKRALRRRERRPPSRAQVSLQPPDAPAAPRAPAHRRRRGAARWRR